MKDEREGGKEEMEKEGCDDFIPHCPFLLLPRDFISFPPTRTHRYYRELKPHVHYIPVAGYTVADLQAAFTYCRTHDAICQSIATAATAFVRRLTLAYAVEQYDIH
jgi:hypothetical protein